MTVLSELCPNSEFIVRHDKIEWITERDAIPTDNEIQTKVAELEAAEPLRQLRIQRNLILAKTDWWVLPDRTATQAQLDYRQALSNITTQTPSLDENGQLTGIIWPTPPSND